MATGIDVHALNDLKKQLLDYIEAINKLSKRFEDSCLVVDQNISGAGRILILNRLGLIQEQFPVVVANINSYISDLNRINNVYQEQDQALVSTVTDGIELLDHMKGE